MTQKEVFLQDLVAEGQRTRKILERVPFDKAAWKPHEKSMSLGALSQHLTNLPRWTGMTILHDELDFAKPLELTKPAESTAELLTRFDARLSEALRDLQSIDASALDEPWTMRHGEQVFFTRPKREVLREFVLSHMIHHRGQLSVYLRLLDVPVPGIYGPTADER